MLRKVTNHKTLQYAVLAVVIFTCVPVVAQRNPTLENAGETLTNTVGTVATNINRSASSWEMILGNSANVGALNGLIGTNYSLIQKEIRNMLMPTVATMPNARTLPLTLFETYASTKEKKAEDVDRYVALIKEMRASLKSGDKKSLDKALSNIPEMAKYDFDGGLSENIAERVIAAQESDAVIQKLEIENENLQKLQAINASKATTLMSGGLTKAPAPSDQSTGGTNNINFNNSTTLNAESKVSLDRVYKITQLEQERLLSAGKVGVNKARQVEKEITARRDFRAFIGSRFTTEQFLHTVVSIELYRVLYQDGDYPPELDNMYNTSLEMMKLAQQQLEAYEYKQENKELAGASEMLLGAFMSNRNYPELLKISRDQKRKVAKYLRNMSELESLLLVRDYEAAENKIKEVRVEATDFDFNKAMAMVRQGKQKSSFALGRAQMAVQSGNVEEAEKFFAMAYEMWPDNPEIQTASFKGSDLKENAVADFDRYWAEDNWRAIAENQLKYATALMTDIPRQTKLRKAVEKIQGIEIAIMKAQELKRRGDKYGTWEALESAARTWTDDNKLNTMRAEASSDAADFVKSLRTAEQFEDKQHYGLALAWYLQAQNLYPVSEFAGNGVKNVSDKIVPSSSQKDKK